MSDEKAIKFDGDKIRFDLLPLDSQRECARVLTAGAAKYGDYNWMKGMQWSRLLAAAKRHIHEMERGVDYDEETGLLHLAHAMCDLSFIIEYYKIYPQGDDRHFRHYPCRSTAIKLDIMLDYHNGVKIMDLSHNFNYLYCYVTDEDYDKQKVIQLIKQLELPYAPVHCLSHVLKNKEVDLFVTNSISDTFESTVEGKTWFLLSNPQNIKYDVGARRIHCLDNLLN